jgi:serine/threonine protein kinase
MVSRGAKRGLSDTSFQTEDLENDNAPDLSDRATVPRYSSLEAIGTGSYGSVYRAWDNLSCQFVAIKCVLNLFRSAGHANRMLREVRLLRRFRHPNIIQCLRLIKPVSFLHFNSASIVVYLYCLLHK